MSTNELLPWQICDIIYNQMIFWSYDLSIDITLFCIYQVEVNIEECLYTVPQLPDVTIRKSLVQ